MVISGDKLYSPQSGRRIFDDLCGSLTHASLFEIVLRGVLKDGRDRPYTINHAIRIAARQANHEIVKYIVTTFNEDIDRNVKCPLHIAVSGKYFSGSASKLTYKLYDIIF